MSLFDFDYYKPTSAQQAVEVMRECLSKGQTALYYGGGTEINTFSRRNKVRADAVIDIKGIGEMTDIGEVSGFITLGAGVSLNQAALSSDSDGLRSVLSQIADHTTRNALTLGGNICGRLPYREAVLPLWVKDAEVIIEGTGGRRTQPLREVFEGRMKLAPEDLLVKVAFRNGQRAWFSKRETEGTRVDYPIMHLYAEWGQDTLILGLSGYGHLPITLSVEDVSLEASISDEMVVRRLMELFFDKARDCQRASAAYRRHLLECALTDMVTDLRRGGVAHGRMY